MESPDPAFILRGSDSSVTALTFHCQDLISGSQLGTLCKWELKTWRISAQVSAHNGQSVLWIYSVAPDVVLSQGRDGLLVVWSITDHWNHTKSFKCSALGFCPSGYFTLDTAQMLAIPSETVSDVNIIDMNTSALLSKLSPTVAGDKKYGMCMDLKVAPIDWTNSSISTWPHLLVAYENGVIILWDVEKLSELSHLCVHSETVMSIDFLQNPSVCSGFSGSVDNILHAWTINEKNLSQLKSVEITNKGINDIAIRGDGKIVATAGWDSRIRVFSVKKMKHLAVLAFHNESVQCVKFSQEGMLAAGSKDKTISVWNIYN